QQAEAEQGACHQAGQQQGTISKGGSPALSPADPCRYDPKGETPCQAERSDHQTTGEHAGEGTHHGRGHSHDEDGGDPAITVDAYVHVAFSDLDEGGGSFSFGRRPVLRSVVMTLPDGLRSGM